MTWQHVLVLGTPVYGANVLQIRIYNQALMWYVCLRVISSCLLLWNICHD